jgi:Kef-type K+ transport system membrane component KefB
MYAIGMELDLDEVRKKLRETILISHTSTVVPFFFGMLTAYFVYDDYADKSTPFLPFALFIGIAMSITAFPVLARIIQEKGLTKSHLGTITLASAANGDITAWCLLAVVIAIAQAGSMLSATYNIVFSIAYMLLMFFVIRPFLKAIGQIYHNKEVVTKGVVGSMFLLLIISSYITEMLGLHALFGAFVAGVVMPTNVTFRKIMTEKVEDVSLSLLLPLFFVSTGLRTELGLLNSPQLWGLCCVFILVAIAGKFGGAMVSARVVGESWKDSLYIGALMNTRGLMELVVLSIGYEMKILPPPIFVMLVIMTLVTTFMTTPLVSFIDLCFRTRDKLLGKTEVNGITGAFKVLLSFGRASNGQVMLKVANQMFAKRSDPVDLTALHLTVGPDINPLHTDNFEQVSFMPITNEAKRLGMNIHTRYEISTDAGNDIVTIVNEEGYDFLLVGAGISLSDLPDDVAVVKYKESLYNRYFGRLKAPESWFYPVALLKDKTKMFIEQTNCSVGVFVNRNFVRATRIIVPIASMSDLFLIHYATTLIKATHGTITYLNVAEDNAEREQVDEALNLETQTHRTSKLLDDKDLSASLLSDYNFMMISYTTWNDISDQKKEALQKMPSTLILNKK